MQESFDFLQLFNQFESAACSRRGEIEFIQL